MRVYSVQWLTSVALANAIGATMLALVVLLISRVVRRPPLVHLLWVLVLVKLITPPLFLRPIEVPANWSLDSSRELSRGSSSVAAIDSASLVSSLSGKQLQSWSPSAAGFETDAAQQPRDLITESPPLQVTPAQPEQPPAAGVVAWRSQLAAFKSRARIVIEAIVPWGVAIWILGSVLWCLAQLAMASRFRSYLKAAIVVDRECDAQAAVVARRMGLSRWPTVRLAESTLSPMLWGLGPRAMILIPRELFERMAPARRATLIAHEMAHFKRGDQWVRLVELVATGCFWWHPVVWWARREIEVAEEQCCDSWVIDKCAGEQRTYAEALLETVDFVSQGGRVAPRTVAASGIGHAPLLRRRLVSIMQGRANRSLSIPGNCVVIAAATLGLPASPVINTQTELQATGDAMASALPAIDPVQLTDNSTGPGPVIRPDPFDLDRGAESPVWATALSADGRFAIDVRRGYRASLRDVRSGETARSGRHTCVAFANDGTHYISGDTDGYVCLHESTSGRVLRKLGQLNGAIRSVDVSPTGQLAVAADDSGLVITFDATSLWLEEQLTSSATPLRCVRFSPDGKQLAFVTDTWLSTRPATVEIWDIESRTKVLRFATPSAAGAIELLDENRLLVAGWDGAVWELATSDGQIVWEGRISKDLVSAASFSRDTRALDAVAAELRWRP